MKAPRCRLCGKKHYGLCKESRLKVPGPPMEVVERALLDPKDPKIGVTDLMRGLPLTPAQKQKAYRERGGDKLRERERLRMAAKRKSDG